MYMAINIGIQSMLLRGLVASSWWKRTFGKTFCTPCIETNRHMKKIKTTILLALLSERVNLDFIMREAVSMAKELEGGFEVAGKSHALKQRCGRRSWATGQVIS